MRVTCPPVLALMLVVPPSPAQVLRLTEPQEIELGRRLAAEVEFHQPLLDDSEVVDEVERLGLRLARKCGRLHLHYRFRVLNSDDVNALALPGGFVYVTRGLLELAGNESELARPRFAVCFIASAGAMSGRPTGWQPRISIRQAMTLVACSRCSSA